LLQAQAPKTTINVGPHKTQFVEDVQVVQCKEQARQLIPEG